MPLPPDPALFVYNLRACAASGLVYLPNRGYCSPTCSGLVCRACTSAFIPAFGPGAFNSRMPCIGCFGIQNAMIWALYVDGRIQVPPVPPPTPPVAPMAPPPPQPNNLE